jgi:imidazolonepropionase-like amidohydrolase
MTGMDDRIGAIGPGKTADLLLVDGDVSRDLAKLRHVETVFLDGYRLSGAELRKAAGLNGMPK